MKKIICLQWLTKNFPIPFSFNLFYNNNNKLPILIIGCKGSEYTGKIETFDKFFNCTINKCYKLSTLYEPSNSFFCLCNYEILFIRGDNIISFHPLHKISLST